MPALDLIPRITLKAVQACSQADLDVFHAVLVKSPEVIPEGLPERIGRADTLTFVHVGTALAAIGALKRPPENYRIRKFTDAKTSERGSDYLIELGWVYVEEDFRGRRLSGAVVQSLLPIAALQRCYATSDATNHRMHSSLTRRGFQLTGQPFPSERDARPLVLFVRPPVPVTA